MAKIRIYQLARDTGVPAEELIAAVRKMGVEVKSSLSGVEPDVAEKVGDVVVDVEPKDDGPGLVVKRVQQTD